MTNAVGYARRFIDFQESILVRLCDSPLAIRLRGKEYFLRANRPDLLNCSSRLQSCSFDAPSLRFSRFSYIVSEWGILLPGR